MGVIVRRPWMQQPRGPVQIERGKALGSKVVTYLPLSSEVPYGTQSNAQKVTLGSAGSYAAGQRGVALDAAGAAAAGSVPIDFSNAGARLSFACSFYWPAYANDDKLLAEYTTPSFAAGTTIGLLLDPNESTTGAFYIGIGINTGTADVSFPRPTAAVWHRLLFTMDSGAAIAIANAYIDGVAQTLTQRSSSYAGAAAFANASLYLFSRSNTSLFGVGRMQDLTIYRGVLTAAEARADYENPYQILLPRRIWVPSATQILRPASDISAGLWTPSTGTDLYAMIDETAADDADYDQTASSASSMTVQLGVGSDPASSADHVVRYRIRSDSGGDITVTLKQGASTIASWTHTPAPSSFTTYAQTLSGGEADSITDYANLRLTIVAI